MPYAVLLAAGAAHPGAGDWLMVGLGWLYFLISAWSVLGPRPGLATHALVAHAVLVAAIIPLTSRLGDVFNFLLWCSPWMLLWAARFVFEPKRAV